MKREYLRLLGFPNLIAGLVWIVAANEANWFTDTIYLPFPVFFLVGGGVILCLIGNTHPEEKKNECSRSL